MKHPHEKQCPRVVCRWCGASPAVDPRIVLRRCNPKGEIGIWECSPYCIPDRQNSEHRSAKALKP